jgi:hypothetical protein
MRDRFPPQLEDVPQEEWYEQNVYESIPRKSWAVLTAKGVFSVRLLNLKS